MQWPSDQELEAASNDALDDVKALLSTLGIDALDMLRSYQAPKPPPSTAPIHPSQRPQTSADLLTFYSSISLPEPVENEIHTYHAALAADSADKTLQMYV